MLRRVTILGLLAILGSAAALSAGASQAATTTDDCSLPPGVLTRSNLPKGVSVVACAAVGRRLYLGRGIGVEVPAPGHAVTASALGVDESTSMVMSVEVSADGEISYGFDAGATQAEALATGTGDPAPAACDDPGYGLLSFKWYDTLQWRFNDSAKPANLTEAQTLDAIRDGGRNIVNAFNDCGEADDVSATISYLGTTTAGVDMFTSDGIVYCDGSANTNGLSTVGFSGMPSGYLGATCTWRTNLDPGVDEATESDMRLNLNKDWTVTPNAEACSGRYDVEYVATHERGHSFGLADLNAEHANLTMYKGGRTCSAAGRTLGLGDIQALRQRY